MKKNKPDCCGHCHPPKDGSAQSSSTVLNSSAGTTTQTTLRVEGMDCADEVEAIHRVLKPLSGVREIKVNLMGGKVVIAHEPDVTAQRLITAIGKAGLKASVPARESETETSTGAQRARIRAVVISGVFTGIGLLWEWFNLSPSSGKLPAFGIGIIAGGWFVVPKGLRALRQLSLDMNVLMTVAVAGAIAIGQWSEGAAVAFLFALSESLEAFSLNRARRAIQSLLKLAPETAWVKRDNQFLEVPVEQVQPGDIVAVKSGARVPVDGEILSGKSSINQAPITGESMPVEKEPGDPVFAGTINGEGSLEVKMTKASSDSTLSKIIHLVEEAQAQKAPSQRFVDQFARYYTPTVFLLALAVLLIPTLAFGGAWHTWIYRSLVLLVIACPCALVISTPVSIVSGLTAMARKGVLIKGGAFLEDIGRLKALAIDKTGTITEGKPKVTQVIPLNGRSEADLIRIVAAIDTHSDHPLAQAVVRHAAEKGVTFPRSEDYQARTGLGAQGHVEGHLYFVGNHRFAHEIGACTPELEKLLAQIEEQSQSVVVVGHAPHDGEKGEAFGVLAVGDTVRAHAAQAVQALHRAGVAKVVMLSGDNQRTVDAIAKHVGIDEANGNLLPEQKTQKVRELAKIYHHVGMIGDGVNDAPAMAAATVGIAMGGAGTDTAIETADVALMQDDLSQVAVAVNLGRRTVRIIQANITFALLVKLLFLVLALAGHTSLWLAILADTGATLVVTANALRLLR